MAEEEFEMRKITTEGLLKAQAMLADDEYDDSRLGILADNVKLGESAAMVLAAVKSSKYKLVKIDLLLEGINRLAEARAKNGKNPETYIEAMEDFTKLLKTCF